MRVYTDKKWGADIDGNRGISVTEYEIDDGDYDTIYEQIMDQLQDLEEGEDIPEYVEITLICPYSEDDIQFEVCVKDYID